MSKIRHLAQGAPLPEWFLDVIQENLTDHVGGNFRITQASPTSLQVVAGAGGAAVSIAVTNPAGAVLGLRYITSTVSASVPGGLAVGTHDIYVTSAANSFANNLAPPPNELDNTNYSFGLKLLASGSTPSGSGSEAYYRKVGTFSWDGTSITGISSTFGDSPSAIPVGGMTDYGGTGDPSASWLVADGRALSRTTYAELFGKFGTTHGPGNGTTTFNIPDCRQKVAVGVGGAHALGSTGGEETHTLSTAESPAHDHGGAVAVGDHDHSVSDPGHQHSSDNDGIHLFATAPDLSLAAAGATGTARYRFTDVQLNTEPATTGIDVVPAGGHGHTIASVGGGGAHNNMQPYVALNKIIRVL